MTIARNLRRMEHPYVIAEIGMHHENDPLRLAEYIAAAAVAGASAVKVQHYRSRDLCAPDCPAHWQGGEMKTQRECLLDPLPEVLASGYVCANDHGVDYVVSFFHHGDFNTIPCDAVKIASGDSSYRLLCRAAAKSGLPVFASTGGHRDWKHLLALAGMIGPDRLIPMHCCVRYPCTVSDANVEANIKRMAAVLNERRPSHECYLLGYSDHCKGVQACLEAVHAGCVVIEKHFTLEPDRTDFDHYHAAPPDQLALICHTPLLGDPGYRGSLARECNDLDTGAHVIRQRLEVDGEEHWWRV